MRVYVQAIPEGDGYTMECSMCGILGVVDGEEEAARLAITTHMAQIHQTHVEGIAHTMPVEEES